MTDPNHDDEIEAAYRDVELPPKVRRSEFQDARRRYVDLLISGSAGTIDHKVFNGCELDEIETVAASHGWRPPGDMAAENRALRQALAHEVSSRSKHVAEDDLADLLNPVEPFNYEQVLNRAGEIDSQRSEGARQLLASAMAEAGIDVTAENFDPVALLQAAANPPPPSEPVDPHTAAAYRAANLPNGRPTTTPNKWNDGGLTGTVAIEAQAAADLQSGKFGFRR